MAGFQFQEIQFKAKTVTDIYNAGTGFNSKRYNSKLQPSVLTENTNEFQFQEVQFKER